jgi:hypothetical protein
VKGVLTYHNKPLQMMLRTLLASRLSPIELPLSSGHVSIARFQRQSHVYRSGRPHSSIPLHATPMPEGKKSRAMSYYSPVIPSPSPAHRQRPSNQALITLLRPH